MGQESYPALAAAAAPQQQGPPGPPVAVMVTATVAQPGAQPGQPQVQQAVAVSPHAQQYHVAHHHHHQPPPHPYTTTPAAPRMVYSRGAPSGYVPTERDLFDVGTILGLARGIKCFALVHVLICFIELIWGFGLIMLLAIIGPFCGYVERGRAPRWLLRRYCCYDLLLPTLYYYY